MSCSLLDSVFVDDFLVSFGMTCRVFNIPAEGLEKGIDEFPAQKL
jgi:hypothetical protein